VSERSHPDRTYRALGGYQKAAPQESYPRKGGHNPEPSQVAKRPGSPAPMRPAATQPASTQVTGMETSKPPIG
jgi:hypothetical protein